MRENGGYLTRGRAGELERRLDELDFRLNGRIDDLERAVRDAEEEARSSVRLVLDLAQKGFGAVLEVYRDAISRERGEEPHDGHHT